MLFFLLLYCYKLFTLRSCFVSVSRGQMGTINPTCCWMAGENFLPDFDSGTRKSSSLL